LLNLWHWQHLGLLNVISSAIGKWCSSGIQSDNTGDTDRTLVDAARVSNGEPLECKSRKKREALTLLRTCCSHATWVHVSYITANRSDDDCESNHNTICHWHFSAQQ